METFYDGYVVDTIIDAGCKAAACKKWEPVELKEWRGGQVHVEETSLKDYDDKHFLVKEEKMPEGKLKIILKDKETGKVS